MVRDSFPAAHFCWACPCTFFASSVRSPASLSPGRGQKGMNGTQEILYQERCEEGRSGKGMDRDGRG